MTLLIEKKILEAGSDDGALIKRSSKADIVYLWHSKPEMRHSAPSLRKHPSHLRRFR